jgi:hypothetical protein
MSAPPRTGARRSAWAALAGALAITHHASAGDPLSPPPAYEPPAGPGLLVDLGTGLGILAGSLTQSTGVGGIYALLDLRVGAYFAQNWGILLGVQGGYGGLTSGCSSSCSNALAYQFPLVVQYAVWDHRHGLYLEAGLALVPTYLASTNDTTDSSSPETLTMSAPFDYKLGGGYRINVSGRILDIRLSIDVGQFAHLHDNSAAADVDADIPDGKRQTHVSLLLGVGYVIAP